MKMSVKAAAKRGDLGNAKLLAKELVRLRIGWHGWMPAKISRHNGWDPNLPQCFQVRSRKAVNRMHASKATMNSVVMQMENQLGALDGRAGRPEAPARGVVGL